MNEIGGRLPDTYFLGRLFGGALQDGGFGRSLPHGDRTAMDALHLALIGQRFQIAASSGETHLKLRDDLIDRDALLLLNVTQEALLSFGCGKIDRHDISLTFNQKSITIRQYTTTTKIVCQ